MKVAVIMQLAISVLLMTGCTVANKSGMPGDIPIIDTHIHLYDTSREGGVQWPKSTDSAIYRPVLAEHFDEICRRNHIAATVIVEASTEVEDNQWILDHVKHNPDRYMGFVGSLPVGEQEFENLLDRFSADKRFVGIRMKSKPGGGKFFTEAVWRDLALLQFRGMVLDVLMASFTLKDINEIASRNPELKIVMNHLTGVQITGEAPAQEWIDAVKSVAEYPNVYCKVSAIFQRSGKRPAPKDMAYYEPFFRVIYDTFGEDRIIYGSNWPVTDRGGSYEEQLDIINEFFASKGSAVLEKLYWKNASEVYGIKLTK